MPSELRDLSARAEPFELAEWMDEPCSYEDFRACLIDLAQVNRVSFGYRLTIQWLEYLISAAKPVAPLRIIDVGCGGGDTLRAIEKWSRRRGVALSLTGIDLNPHATRAAKEFSVPDCGIQWITADAYSYLPTEGIDVVLSSLFTHHLSTAEVVTFLRWMEKTARQGWFINDLQRTRAMPAFFSALAKAASWHRFVQHDGPVSFRRSFRPAEWRRLCADAGLDVDALCIESRFPGRLCVGRIK